MADVNISVGIGGDATAFEAALNKAKALGKRWASDTAGENARAAGQVADAWRGGFGKMVQAAIRFGGVLGMLPQEARNVVSAISSVFQAAGGSPIALALASIAAAGVNVFRTLREEADAAIAHVSGVMDTLRKREDAMRVGVKSLDPVVRAKAKLTLGDEYGAAQEAADLRTRAASLTAGDQGNSVGARQRRVEAGELTAQAAQIEAAMGAARDKKMREQTERDQAAFRQRQQAAQQEQERRKQDAARAAALTESRRAAELAFAPDEAAANRRRMEFLAEDFRAARAQRDVAARGGQTGAATEAQTRMNNLLAEAAEVLKDIRKNTESSKQ